MDDFSGLPYSRDLPHIGRRMSTYTKRFVFAGWLIPVALAVTYFGRWIREIVVPTLKGGNFEQLYDLHGVRYLDTTLAFTVLAFAWFAAVFLTWLRRNVE